MKTKYHPEAPEAVALELFRLIREAERGEQDPPRGRNVSRRADLLALYAECLARVNGGTGEAPLALH